MFLLFKEKKWHWLYFLVVIHCNFLFRNKTKLTEKLGKQYKELPYTFQPDLPIANILLYIIVFSSF